MTDSYRNRCVECGDNAIEDTDYCARHALQSANPFEAIARGHIEAVAPEDAEAARARRVTQEFKMRVWRDRVLGITRSWVSKNAFAPAQETASMRIVRDWLAKGCKRNLVLRGPVGVGKTSAACLAVARWVEPQVYFDAACGEPKLRMQPDAEKGIPRDPGECVAWLRPDQLVSAIIHAYDPHAPKLERFVVIDDMGRETRAEFVEALCEMLDRDNHKLLITSNLPKEDMRKRYGKEPRLLDRLRDRCDALDVVGESLRRKNDQF